MEWESILESGETYLASISVVAAATGPSAIRYAFASKGRPVELEWTGVLTESTLAVARRQDDGLVSGRRLVLRTSEEAQFTVTGDGLNVGAITAPLSIFTPEGLLLYRDNHRGLALVSGDVAQ